MEQNRCTTVGWFSTTLPKRFSKWKEKSFKNGPSIAEHSYAEVWTLTPTLWHVQKLTWDGSET